MGEYYHGDAPSGKDKDGKPIEENAYLRRVSTAKGQRWRGSVYHIEDGKRSWRTRVFDESVTSRRAAIKEFKEWKARLEQEHNDQVKELARQKEELRHRKENPGAYMTVGEYARKYLADVVLMGLSPEELQDGTDRKIKVPEASTIKGYRKNCQRISAQFGEKTLPELTSADVIEWRNQMVDEGLSANTIGKNIKFLRRMCEHARESDHIIEFNPVTKEVKAPSAGKTNPTTLEPTEIARMLHALDEMEPTPLVVAAHIGLYAGLRQGEVCGLRWRDVDFEKHNLHVCTAIGSGTGGSYVKGTKTHQVRDVAICPQLMDVLAKRRSVMYGEWASIRLQLGLPATEGEFANLYVIGKPDGRYMIPAVLSREWASFARNHNIRDNKGGYSSFHNLRHSNASLLINSGFDAVTVAKLLGHAKPSMTTDTYAAAFEERAKMASKSVAKTIGEAFAAFSTRPAQVVTLDTASGK